MKVFIANFGEQNYLWPSCLERPSVATFDDEDVHGFWVDRNRAGYVEYSLAHKKTARGETPTKPVASRWFGLMDVISSTADDLWIHREKADLWWTFSTSAPVQIELRPSPRPERHGRNVHELHKPTTPWSDRTKSAAKLSWNALHPKAKDFLFTEGTLQQLQPDNADYALALINGDDLLPWHSRPGWRAKVAKSGRDAATSFSARQRAIWRMVETVDSTVRSSNGQQVVRTIKNKELKLSIDELKIYIDALIDDQDGLCALTGLRLQFDGDHDNIDCLCSLDRIDSDGHYEIGNLQVVCRFANRWKSDGDDDHFRKLIDLVRSTRF